MAKAMAPGMRIVAEFPDHASVVLPDLAEDEKHGCKAQAGSCGGQVGSAIPCPDRLGVIP